MSERRDITDGLLYRRKNRGLIYTKILGWIDLGHARGADMVRLKRLLFEEKGRKFFPELNEWYFPVDYYQEMAKQFKSTTLHFWGGVNAPLMVRSCLSDDIKKRIALTIMMKTAWRFEAFQESSIIRRHTDSGFSCEDLVSDLVGFYRIFGDDIDPLLFSQPTSLPYALSIWDHYGPVGSFKNRGFKPLLFPKPSSPGKLLPRQGLLPSWLNYIKPLDDLTSKYISNRFHGRPVEGFFKNRNKINIEIYGSVRTGFGFRDKISMPSHFYINPHYPKPPDYFSVKDEQ